MGKYILLTACFLTLFFTTVSAQRVDFDKKQNESELVNQAARLSADNFMNARFKSIEDNKKIALENLTLINVIQTRVYNSLTTVDKSLRQGKSVVQASSIVSDIINYQVKIIKIAESDPILLLFAEKMETDFELKAADLILYITNTVMLQKGDLLMNVGQRDQLLNHVINELRVLRAISYAGYRKILLAQYDNMLKLLNPWQGFVNKDREKAGEILFNLKF